MSAATHFVSVLSILVDGGRGRFAAGMYRNFAFAISHLQATYNCNRTEGVTMTQLGRLSMYTSRLRGMGRQSCY